LFTYYISLDFSELKELLRDESPVEAYVEWLEAIYKTQVLRVSTQLIKVYVRG